MLWKQRVGVFLGLSALCGWLVGAPCVGGAAQAPDPPHRPPQDPCRNHKTYREVLAKMKPPLIPFIPLILKGAVGGRSGGVLLLPMGPALTSLSPSDLTFLHEGSKTLLDGLVNVEKLVGAMPRGAQWGSGGPGGSTETSQG